MMVVFTDLLNFFLRIFDFFKNLPPNDKYILFGNLAIFFFSLFFIRLVFKFKPPKTRLVIAILYAVFAVIYAIGSSISYKYLQDIIFKFIYRDVTLTLSAILVYSSIFSLTRVKRLLKLTAYVLLLSTLTVELIIIFSTDPRIINVLNPLRKLLLVLSIYPLAPALVSLLHIQKGRLKMFLNLIVGSLFLIILVLWEFNFIDFGIFAFIGLGLLIVVTLVYVWFFYYEEELINKLIVKLNIYLPEEDITELTDTAKKLLFLLLLFTYYEIGKYFLNFDALIPRLAKVYIIKTDIFALSVYSLITGIFTFLFFIYSINILKKVLKLLYPPEEREDKGKSLEVVVYNLGILFAVTVTLSVIGLTWKGLLPIAGALGIGLGFGLQTVLNNYISGFILMFSKNLKIGDFIELEGNAGKFVNVPGTTIFGRVENISILSTRIRTLDGIDILIPNSTFIGNQIINYSLRNPYVRIRFPFGVAYSSDPRKVKEILLELAYKCPWAKNYYKPPQVWFKKFGDSALIFELLFWIDIRDIWHNTYATQSFSLIDWIYTNGFLKLKEAGIEIPFPQNDVWFRNNLRVVVDRGEKKPEDEGLKSLTENSNETKEEPKRGSES
jgi:potassium efflux system protein